MILLVKNKVLNLRKSSKVIDETDNESFIVKGKLIGSKKKVTDLDKNVLYIVKNRPFHFIHRSAYVLDADGNKLMLIKDNKFIKGFTITDENDEYELVWGGWLTGVNEVLRNGKVIGVIKRKIRLHDTFELTLENAEDAPLLVAITIAIDNIVDKMKKIKR